MRAPIVLTLAGLLLAAPAMQAQAPEMRSRALRQQIEERFAQRVRQELRLSNEQDIRVQQIARQYSAQRLDLEDRQQDLRQALGQQMRPGIAANQDSVAKLTDALITTRIAYMTTYQSEIRDLGQVLTPLQVAQFFLIRDRLLQRAQELREERQNQPGVRRRP